MSSPFSLRGALRRGFYRLLRRPEDERLRPVLDVLQTVPLFATCGRGALVDLAEVMHRRRYRPDEVVYYEGDPGLGLFLVLSGQVALLAEDDAGVPHEVRRVGPGDFFGEIALLGDFRRTETARAAGETEVLGFFSPDLAVIARRHPRAGIEVTTALARHLAARQGELIHAVAQRDGRLAAQRLLGEAADAVHIPSPPAAGAPGR